MDKVQRLEILLQAIGEPHLFKLYNELKLLQKDSLDLTKEREEHQYLIDLEDQKNQRLKVEVDKQEEKLRIKEHLKSLELYKMNLDYAEMQATVQKIKDDKKPVQEKLNKINLNVIYLREHCLSKTSELKEVTKQLIPMQTKVLQRRESIIRKEAEMSELQEKISTAKINYQNKLEERNNQIIRLREIETQIKVLQELHNKTLIELPMIEEQNNAISDELENIKNQLHNLGNIYTSKVLEKNKYEIRIKDRTSNIEKMKDEQNKKLEFLRQRFNHVYEATTWLQQNKNKFRAPIHYPMLLLLKVKNDNNRKYIENYIHQRDLISFICEDKEDSKLFHQIVRVEKNLSVNIAMVPDYPIEHYQSPILTDEYKNLGIECFLKDIIQAPDAIMRFLCHCYKLHKIPLCSSEAVKNIEIISKIFRIFLTPNVKITAKYSKYGEKNICIKEDLIKECNFLQSSEDYSEQLEILISKNREEEAEMNRLTTDIKLLYASMKDLTEKETEQRNKKNAILNKKKNISNIEKLLEQKIEACEKKQNEMIDEEEEKNKLKLFVQKVIVEKLKIYLDMFDDLKDFINLKKEKMKLNLKAILLSKKLEKYNGDLFQRTVEQKKLENKMEEFAKKRKETKANGMILFHKLKESMGTDEDKQKQLFGHFEQTLDNVELEISRLQTQLELNSGENESALVEYEERKKKIAEFQKKLVHYNKKLDLLNTVMKKKKGEWLPVLQTHITNINNKFSHYYKQLNCAGEISLDTCNNTDDFYKYGLQIILKYRDDEPFVELSNSHHSGGECSVAAIVFILSLQELAFVPFTCIDEINQGMDSENERKIYDLISETVKKSFCTQYFLLTPKLLMDLDIIEHKDINVHIIYNSCFMEMKMDVRKHIEISGRN